MCVGGSNLYLYRKNLQGDITGIYSGSTGTLLVSYVYDAWGKPTITDEAGTTESGNLITRNPYLYRGYRYDHETGLYYLNSRYYDPETGRFLNADDHIDTSAGAQNSNLFVYCGNDPINRIDPNGTDWLGWVVAAVIVVGLVAASIVTCGGAAAAAGAAAAIATGTCTMVSTTATVVTGAALGAGTAFAVTALSAAAESNSLDEFASYGDVAAINTGVGAVFGTIDGYVNSQTACFIAGTVIKAKEGNKPIEEISPGDMVWAWDENTKGTALKKVVETYVRETDELVHVRAGNEEIITTPTHPFWVHRKGWTAAIELRAGDILLTVNDEYVIVEQVQHEILEAPVKVYNFQVEEYHTYFISRCSILVHNQCGPENKSPEGSGRHGAFRQAKRDLGIPVSQQPDSITPNINLQGKVSPGRVYNYGDLSIRDDVSGHFFPDGGHLGPHFNTDIGHYFY